MAPTVAPVRGPTSQPRVINSLALVPARRDSEAVAVRPTQAADKRAEEQKLSAAERKAKGIDFDLWFPNLMKALISLEEQTSLEDYKLNLKFATDEELSSGTRAFFNE